MARAVNLILKLGKIDEPYMMSVIRDEPYMTKERGKAIMTCQV